MRALVIVLALSSLARADKLEDAKAAFAVGKQAFERGEYEMALAQFQKAEALAPAPSLLYNIGRTFEALGRFREAAQMYDRYLEQVGPPKNDEEKQFQNNLAARSSADKSRPDRGAAEPRPAQPQYAPPPPQYYPPPYGYQPQPYPYYGYPIAPVTPQLTRAQELDNVRRRRGRAVALTISGIVPGLVGLGLMAAGGACSSGDCLAVFEATGVLMFLACPPLLIPGAVSWAKSQKKLDELNRMPAETPPPAQPGLQTRIFSIPPLRF